MRHVFTAADRAFSALLRTDQGEAQRLRRDAERALLDRLLAELAMPEWYPER